jgi:hypothetical protein
MRVARAASANSLCIFSTVDIGIDYINRAFRRPYNAQTEWLGQLMELHQLEAFSAVMSAGSITGAGRLLERSQPAVTRQIQELEADLGYALFNRNGPRVTPTHRAFLLYEEVERSLIGLKSIEQRARAIVLG